jgi:hypothetical protein
MKQKGLVIGILALGLFAFAHAVSAGTISSTYKFAWSNNSGYVNFEDTIVNDSSLTGYAWSALNGWIKMNPALGGVHNNGNGVLSGFAWGEGLGWIDFSNVRINSAGRFSGTATGTLIGTLTFDCPNYCNVQTDWRPASQVVSGGGGGGGGGGSSYVPMPHVTAIEVPLTVSPTQSGTIFKDLPSGQVIIKVSTEGVYEKTTFTITEGSLPSSPVDASGNILKPASGVLYDISAVNAQGTNVTGFPAPLVISLPIPSQLIGASNLGVYAFNSLTNQWTLVPDTVFGLGRVSFLSNTVSKFAVFYLPPSQMKPVPTGYVFKKDLKTGMTDPDVKELQKFLNTHGFPVATTGSGSKGKETTFYGSLTYNALIKFQKAHNLPTNGQFGAATRSAINAMQ